MTQVERWVEALHRAMAERRSAADYAAKRGRSYPEAESDARILCALAAAIEKGQEAWKHPETGGLRFSAPVSPNFRPVLVIELPEGKE